MPDLVPHLRNAQTAAEAAGNELVFSVAATRNRVNVLTPTVGALRDSHAHLQESHYHLRDVQLPANLQDIIGKIQEAQGKQQSINGDFLNELATAKHVLNEEGRGLIGQRTPFLAGKLLPSVKALFEIPLHVILDASHNMSVSSVMAREDMIAT